MVFAFNPSLRSSGQPQRSAWGPTPGSKPAPRSRVMTGDRAVRVLMVGATGAPGGNLLENGEKMQTPHRKVLPQPSHWSDGADGCDVCVWTEFTFQQCSVCHEMLGATDMAVAFPVVS